MVSLTASLGMSGYHDPQTAFSPGTPRKVTEDPGFLPSVLEVRFFFISS